MTTPVCPGPRRAVSENLAALSTRQLGVLSATQLAGLSAADVLLIAGAPVTLRLAGALTPVPGPVLTADDTHSLLLSMLTPAQQQELQRAKSVDLCFNREGIGRFRAKTDEGAIDPSGTLPDGKTFQGPAELRAILKAKQELVVRNLAEKLLTYGIGRGLEFYDNRALNQICAQAAQADHKFSALVIAIVKSDPFRLRRGTSQVETVSNLPKKK